MEKLLYHLRQARTVNAILLATVALLLTREAVVFMITGSLPESSWQGATEEYVKAHVYWLDSGHESGYAVLDEMAIGPEKDRLQEVKQAVTRPLKTEYLGGQYSVSLQVAGQALVRATYRTRGVREGMPFTVQVTEDYLLVRTLPGIKVKQVAPVSRQEGP
jgi:hypothetical protein